MENKAVNEKHRTRTITSYENGVHLGIKPNSKRCYKKPLALQTSMLMR